MPLWTATGVITTASKNTPVTVFNAELLSDGNESMAVALPSDTYSKGADLTFNIIFGSPPSTVNYQLQIALNNVDAEFYDIGTPITDTAGGKLTINGAVARFARVKAVDSDVETVTSQIMVG